MLHIYIHTYIYIYIHMYIACMHMCVYIIMCVYIYIYIMSQARIPSQSSNSLTPAGALVRVFRWQDGQPIRMYHVLKFTRNPL